MSAAFWVHDCSVSGSRESMSTARAMCDACRMGWIGERARTVSIPKAESKFIEQYGRLPTPAAIEKLRAEWDDNHQTVKFDDEWHLYWRKSDPTRDLLERLYEFWSIIRKQHEGA